MDMPVLSHLKLMPQPQEINLREGCFQCDPGLPIEVGRQADRLVPILAREWPQEFLCKPDFLAGEAPGYGLSVGALGRPPLVVPQHPEAYALEITPGGIQACARSYTGLVHAWQTLKQIVRHNPRVLPCLHIIDQPQLDWRIYHLDFKGTRRCLANLHALLPRLAEFKINAVLAEYEDFIRLERHPDIARPDALSGSDIAAWIQAARDYGITVIPLVQTLGHLQYALAKPAYEGLQEKPGDPAEACPSNPDTWRLVSDFLDEIMPLHPDSPFINVGLDETFNLGTCPRCVAGLAGRPRKELYVDWLNRVCRHVVEQGRIPLVWGDIVLSGLDKELARRLNRDAVYFDWGYRETGALSPWMLGARGGPRLSREWLHRPNSELDGLASLKIGPGSRFFEDLPPEEQAEVKVLADNGQFPMKMKTGLGLRRLSEAGFKTGATSGIRVSFHGCMMPKFITGQLNTLQWAAASKQYGARMLVGSSWSRGGTFAGSNAHPELDWYGIATLADSGWATLTTGQLRDFDRRFAFQFFGLPDGAIGDLYFMCERTDSRVDHLMDNYLSQVLEESRKRLPDIRRNRDCFELFMRVVEAQILRFRAQFATLELEYFYSTWERVPVDFRERIRRDIAAVVRETEVAREDLRKIYARTLIEPDAAELVATQLDFFKDIMQLAAKKVFSGQISDR